MILLSGLVAALLGLVTLAHATAPVVTLVDAPGACSVTGRFTVAVSRSAVWKVLTDYESIPSYVSSMRSSRLESGDRGRPMLRQEAVARVFLFQKRMSVLLELEEDSGRSVGFYDVLGRDFVDYAGAWTISEVGGATQVEYELSATPRAAVARALCRSQMRGTALKLLEQVQAEIVRRAKDAPEPEGAR